MAAPRGAAESPAGALCGDYVVGQVVGSLFSGGAAAVRPLAGLFRAAAPPPMLVAVPRENRKRKHTEAEKVSEGQSSSVREEPPKKVKKTRKKELSKAEEKLAKRESALEQADEDEERKLFQSKAKQKQRASHAVAKSDINSGTGRTVKQEKKKNEAEEMIKNKRTVFVGNLPVNYTAQMLKSLFKEYGQIESIRFRSVVPAEVALSRKLAAIKRKIHPNVKYINAYVVFKEEHAAVKALKKTFSFDYKRNGTEVASGFHIRVDGASNNSLHDNKRSVFLGNLAYDISDSAVREHFADCGDVVAVRIVRDRQSGMGKGFGYVLFENTDAVHLALKLNNSDLMGRKLRVKRCSEKDKAPQKSTTSRSRGPKDRAQTMLKNKSGSHDSFVGEKANPAKKSTKPKRLKSISKKKGGKNK
ncbi:RNA-binding protein 34 isoform X1 [Tympanuchus pallidicinctus]|uniref:RNA-binding protein 34 isoform X1 n=1 Tax=Tympanuchus pallidicinctus TaxID=109042 RepID=UPI00228736C7|nr:RNA-binding protein 34 isoform X1 [Tympanuchus pallidicinctus]